MKNVVWIILGALVMFGIVMYIGSREAKKNAGTTTPPKGYDPAQYNTAVSKLMAEGKSQKEAEKITQDATKTALNIGLGAFI